MATCWDVAVAAAFEYGICALRVFSTLFFFVFSTVFIHWDLFIGRHLVFEPYAWTSDYFVHWHFFHSLYYTQVDIRDSVLSHI